MNNSSKYDFSDFTIANYTKLLKIAKKNFQFKTFSDFDKDKDFLLWRHDIDFSVHRAKKLAQIEFKEKIKSTYFIHLHSDFYNFFEKEIRDILLEVIKLGHKIGLHFDCNFYGIENEKGLENYLLFEKNIIQKILKKTLHAFSFHNPGKETIKFKKYSYAGMVNVYSDYFWQKVPYVADSNGYWRFERLENILKEARVKKLQVLTHPGWWQDKAISPRERIKRCIDGRAIKTALKYDSLMKKDKRENIK